MWCLFFISSACFLSTGANDSAGVTGSRTQQPLIVTKEFLDSIPPVDFARGSADRADVRFAAFNRANPEGVEVTPANVGGLRDQNDDVKVLVHGYMDSWRSPWYDALREEYLNRSMKVVFVDWAKAASHSNYSQAAANAGPVADYVSDFLLEFAPAERLHLIGASLGGQLVGLIGKEYARKSGGGRVGRITALDPAGAGFGGVGDGVRLNSSDAAFVDVVHTDGGLIGYGPPAGHVDFYPNGGKNQPGCPPTNIDSFCSHSRAVHLFVESISHDDVFAIRGKWINGEVKELEEKDKVIFGDRVPVTSRGVYFFKTAAVYPFLRI